MNNGEPFKYLLKISDQLPDGTWKVVLAMDYDGKFEVLDANYLRRVARHVADMKGKKVPDNVSFIAAMWYMANPGVTP